MAVPAQTTGHHLKSIWKTQFSTAGQSLVVSSGAEIDIEGGGKVEVQSGGWIEAKSGAFIKMESGSTFRIQSGGSVDVEGGATVTFSSAAIAHFSSGSIVKHGDFLLTTGTGTGSTLTAHGISVLTSTRPGAYELSAPYKGAWKKLIFIPSSGEHQIKVKVAREYTTNAWPVHIGSTKAHTWGRPVVINFKTSGQEAWLKGGSIDLLGLSTNQWVIAGMHMSSQTAYLSLTTSTG